jgi:hypothetical protein
MMVHCCAPDLALPVVFLASRIHLQIEPGAVSAMRLRIERITIRWSFGRESV